MICTSPDCEENAEEEDYGFCPEHLLRACDLRFTSWVFEVFATEHPYLFKTWKRQRTPDLAKEWIQATTGRKVD